MKRQSLVTAAVVVALCALGACSGGSGGSDDETKTVATTKATSAAPSTPAPVVETQPPGPNGVTYVIQDWDRYRTDEAVVAWTSIAQDLGASTNQGKLVPGLATRTSKKVLRIYSDAVNFSRRKDYHVAEVGDVKVSSSKVQGDRAELTMCMWSTTTGVRDKNDKAIGDDESIWFKQDAVLSKASGQWVLKSIEDTGTCGGGAPKRLG